METVHKDYLGTLHQLADVLPAASNADPEVLKQACLRALEFVQPRSRELEVLRDTLRSYASLRDRFQDSQKPSLFSYIGCKSSCLNLSADFYLNENVVVTELWKPIRERKVRGGRIAHYCRSV